MKTTLSLIACLTLAFTAAAYARAHAFIWDSTTGMTDLGSLGGDSEARGVNDNGQVVGYSWLADQSTIHMVTWTTAGGLVDLGSIDNSTYSEGKAINSAGDIVGQGSDANGVQVIFFWSAATGYINLGEVPHGYGVGFDINDGDTIAGVGYGLSQGVIWRPSFRSPRYIGTLPGGSQSIARGINNHNHITGSATLSTGAWDAIVFDPTGGIHDIGTVQRGVATSGVGINDNDEVVGSGGVPYRPFYWREGSGISIMATLGGTNADALAINNSGAIAGDSQTPAGLYHATLWSSHDASPQDLGTLPGGTTSVGSAINSSGQVVGWADIP